MSIADTGKNPKKPDPLVAKPLRLRQSNVDRLTKQMSVRGYETLSPVIRMAISKGLDVMEQEGQ